MFSHQNRTSEENASSSGGERSRRMGSRLERPVPRQVLTIGPVLLIGSRKMPESQGQLNRVMVKKPKDEAMIYPASK